MSTIELDSTSNNSAALTCFVCNTNIFNNFNVSFYQVNKMEKYTGLVPLELLRNCVQELEIEVDDADKICSKCFILLRQFYQFYREVLRISTHLRAELYRKYEISEVKNDLDEDDDSLIYCGKCEYQTTNKGLLRNHQSFHNEKVESQSDDDDDDADFLHDANKLDSDQCYLLSQVGRFERLRMVMDESSTKFESDNENEKKSMDDEFKTVKNGIYYKCNRCSYDAKDWREYFVHLDKTHKAFTSTDPRLEMDDTLNCNYCDKVLPDFIEKSKHLTGHRHAIRKKKIRAFYRALRIKNPTYKPFTPTEREMYGIRETFDCRNCHAKFRKQIDIFNHSRNVHHMQHDQIKAYYETKYDVTCKECKQVFPSYKSKLQHAREHRDMNEIEKQFIDFRSDLPIENESIIVNPPQPQIIVDLNLVKHPRPNIESQFRMVKCDICSKQLIAQSLEYHRGLHLQESTISCHYCDLKFKGIQQLKAHERRSHREQQFICEICGSSFKMPSELALHKKWHENPYPFECSICGKRYRYANALPVHMRTAHTKEKPHSCNECGERFVSSAKLLRHKRIHNGGFKCSHCNKEYYTKYA
uniref:CSON008374 protein n=1 Tax=Culicoides sonorensis TaxID=179676 RepID=A0A336KD00_CULSO